MKNRRLYYLSNIFLCLVLTVKLIFAQLPPPEIKTNQTSNSEEDLIHLGDLIDVDFIGSVEYDWRGRVNTEGFLPLPTFNEDPVFALCRDEETVAAGVAKAYSKILRQPKVVVKILDRSNRPPSVIYGAIKTPQRFRLNRPVFLNEILIDAGGFTENVSGEVQIFRPKSLNCLTESTAKQSDQIKEEQENPEKFVPASQSEDSQYISIKISDLITGKSEANPQILSGDVINVFEAESVYVTGGVANPRTLAFRSKLTVSRAIDSAGGLTKDALEDKITIYRRENNSTKLIEVDLKKARASAAEDVELQASDIIDVSQKGIGKRKFLPVVRVANSAEKAISDLPLRVID